MIRTTLLVSSLLVLVPAVASADIRHLEAIQTIEGGLEPVGPIPWVRAAFDDEGREGKANLIFESLNLTGAEHVTGLYLNLNPAFDPQGLGFFTIIKHGDFATPAISKGRDAFQAEGDGFYDLYLEFPSSTDPLLSFGPGDSFSMFIGSNTGLRLTAAAFDFPSAPGSDAGPFYMAARIEGVGPNGGTAWVATPEPSSLVLACAAFLLVVAWPRAANRRQSGC